MGVTLKEDVLKRIEGEVASGRSENLSELLEASGFDREQHERIRDDLRRGLIGLAQNRLPASAAIEDVRPGDVTDARRPPDADIVQLGRKLAFAATWEIGGA